MVILLRISLYRTCHPPTIHSVKQNGLENDIEGEEQTQGGAQRLSEAQYHLDRVLGHVP